jgi:hypothetical protein
VAPVAGAGESCVARRQTSARASITLGGPGTCDGTVRAGHRAAAPARPGAVVAYGVGAERLSELPALGQFRVGAELAGSALGRLSRYAETTPAAARLMA